MFENLKELGVEVAFASITPPGQDELPYDARVCAHVGPHKHGKGFTESRSTCLPAPRLPRRARNLPAEPTRIRCVRPFDCSTIFPALDGSRRPVTIEPLSWARSSGRTLVEISAEWPTSVRAWKTPGLRVLSSKEKTPSVSAFVCATTVQPDGSLRARKTSASSPAEPWNRIKPS